MAAACDLGENSEIKENENDELSEIETLQQSSPGLEGNIQETSYVTLVKLEKTSTESEVQEEQNIKPNDGNTLPNETNQGYVQIDPAQTSNSQSKLGSFAETVTMVEFPTDTETISESANEESRIFLENVLQAAADKDSRETTQKAIDEETDAIVVKTDTGDVVVWPENAEKNYRVVTEVGIQANDYEIERRSGRVPARQRIIPAKFRDYKNPVDSDQDDGDSDFEPYFETVPTKRKSSGKRGRPRKEPAYSIPSGSDIKVESIEALGRIIPVSTGFKCPGCGKHFSQKGNLKVHMWTHTTARPFTCDIEGCDKTYKSNESLRKHKLVHMGIKPFECEKCQKKFSSAATLKEHMSIHEETKPHTCDVCNRSFRQVSCFRRHLITHTTSAPYACKVCDRRFSQMVYLRSHMKTHTGARPFQCDKCNKAFAHQSDLARHKIIHTGIKPYECTICGARFSDPSSRRRHFREHTITKPFECTICGEKFKRQNQIRAHMSRWHGNEIKKTNETINKDTSKEQLQVVDVNNTVVMVSDKESLGEIDMEALANQRKIISIIQNLNTGYVVQEVEISSPTNQNQEEMDQSQEGLQNVNVVSDDKVEVPNENQPDGEKTLIAIAEVQDDGKGENSSALPECAYQIIQELADGSGENQVYEIQYQTSDNKMETSIVQLDTRPPEQTATPAEIAAQTLMEIPSEGVDFVKDPDFASQDYFNWLSNFTEMCKVLTMPLQQELFQKISQVHKSITDFMAMPSGVLNDKENFRVLMSISKDLNSIISNHLAYVMESMDAS